MSPRRTRAVRPAAVLTLLCLLFISAGCPPQENRSPSSAVPGSGTGGPGLFTDVAEAAGVRFTHNSGARGRKRFIEITGSGCAFFDYDQDGWSDILLLDAGPLPGDEGTQRNALFRNLRDGRFADVTGGSGLEYTGYTQGVAAGDYDNDGFPDLYVTAYGGNRLLRNLSGSGKFQDVTEHAGVGDRDRGKRYALSAAWGDYDRDGNLDLAVCHYARWSPETDRPCTNSLGAPSYCSPEAYVGDGIRLYRSRGDGGFVDVTEKTGLAGARRRAMGVTWLDYNADGREDLFVTCDLHPNLLFRQTAGGAFEEAAVAAGVAYGDMGGVLSGMGIGVGDYDNDGLEDLHVTNFSHQPNSLYRNQGDGLFENWTVQSGIGEASNRFLGWGCDFFDYDRDGLKDLIVANGHMHEDVAETVHGVTYRQPKSLYRNAGDGSFTHLQDGLGALAVPTLGRGLAIADFNNDGSLDILVNNQNGPAQLLRNEYRGSRNWIAFQPQGTKSNRSGIQAHFVVKSGGTRQVAVVRTGSSYCSSSEPRVYFGLPGASVVDEVRVEWPGGGRATARNLAAERVWRWVEGEPAPRAGAAGGKSR